MSENVEELKGLDEMEFEEWCEANNPFSLNEQEEDKYYEWLENARVAWETININNDNSNDFALTIIEGIIKNIK